MSLHVSIVMPVYNERHLVAESIRRVLALESPLIERLDLIVVDDGSTDGSREIVQDLAARHPDRIETAAHERNRGKGAAVRTGIARARGAVTLIHDADLEYNPRDIPNLLVPFVEQGADAVYGSRFVTTTYRRVLYYRHQLGNRLLTSACNLLTDLNLTDVETCYKAVRTGLLQSIPIRSHDFRLEVELTFKLAKRGARIFEVPISYAGRSYEEGKKIGLRDALLAAGAMLHWWIIDDLYDPEQHGPEILTALSQVPRLNRWTGDTLRPFIGDRVLELAAGLGNIARTLIPRDRYTVCETNPHHLAYLRSFAEYKPYLEVRRADPARPQDFDALEGRYDTVLCLNVLERLDEDAAGARNVFRALEPGGRAIVLVPHDPALRGTLDDVLEHRRRYTAASLRALLEKEGFEVERIFEMNRTAAAGWWWNGKVLRRRHFSRVQLKAFDWMVWLVRRVDRALPWSGASLIALARRP